MCHYGHPLAQFLEPNLCPEFCLNLASELRTGWGMSLEGVQCPSPKNIWHVILSAARNDQVRLLWSHLLSFEETGGTFLFEASGWIPGQEISGSPVTITQM